MSSPRRPIIQLVANGDLRPAANRNAWPAQAAMERKLTTTCAALGARLRRAHPVRRTQGHGFIGSQKEGIAVFAKVDRNAPLLVAASTWQYSHHLLPGLLAHRGPILTVANWSGTWPGLVGTLNLNACLTKAGVPFASLWSETFDDAFFRNGLARWLQTGHLQHPQDHVRPFDPAAVPAATRRLARQLAAAWRARPAILGVFDEGCMGMYNAIIPDELLFPLGVFKERLSQSALYHAATQVDAAEAEAIFAWYERKGFRFHFGTDDATELTRDQVLWQCRTYLAAGRLADEFGCAAIGIQYQQGLKDLLPASDLVEGTLNNADRPPLKDARGRLIRRGEPILHFNEVDECAGLDGLLLQHVHRALGQPLETTLHDLRWGDHDRSGTTDAYVWVFEISGAAPPAHHVGGWAGSDGVRQPPMYFARGGSTLRGVAKPGEIVWSRVFIASGQLHLDLGRATVVGLPAAETERRWAATNREWPIMHAVLHGVTRDQMMARHASNHIKVAYADSAAAADRCLATRAALAHELGVKVHLCGV